MNISWTILVCFLIFLIDTIDAYHPNSKIYTLGARKVFAIGDLHGDLKAFRKILRMLNLIDIDDHWSGGKAILVQTGDIADKGPNPGEIWRFLMRLRAEAKAAGGRVEALLGNHEIMNLHYDWTYNKNDDAGTGNERNIFFSRKHPVGSFLMSLNTAFMVDGTVFVHGGLEREFARLGISGINALVRQQLWLPDGAGKSHPVFSRSGPFWSRKFSRPRQTPEEMCEDLQEALRILKAKRMVVGHTIQQNGRISSDCDGQLLKIDIAISKWQKVKGIRKKKRHLGALMFDEQNNAFEVYPDSNPIPIPFGSKHYMTNLIDAVERGDLNQVSHAISNNIKPPSNTLITAIEKGDLKMVKLLLQAGVNPNYRNNLPIVTALNSQYPQSKLIVKYLIANGANIKSVPKELRGKPWKKVMKSPFWWYNLKDAMARFLRIKKRRRKSYS